MLYEYCAKVIDIDLERCELLTPYIVWFGGSNSHNKMNINMPILIILGVAVAGSAGIVAWVKGVNNMINSKKIAE